MAFLTAGVVLQILMDRLKSWPLYVLPHHFCSRLVFKLTRLESRWVPAAIRQFCRVFDVDLDQAKKANSTDYATFNQFFTRELKPGARPITPLAGSIASPVDARVSAAGRITDGSLIQAKNHHYSLLELLGGRQQDAAPFADALFTTLYLSPRDYHRIHMPVDGQLRATHHVPGRLFSVAPHTVRTVPRLFARNERVVALFDTAAGKMAMVLVGAINVAAIETVWSGLITPPAGKHLTHNDQADDDTVDLLKGAEMGRFNMGSTVILIMQKGAQWNESLQPGKPVKLGQAIGQHPV